MAQQKRFQLDLTEEELTAINHLGSLAGLKTKREVLLTALTLFRWAAKETLYGRTVGSFDASDRIRQLELPALSAIAEKRPVELSQEEIQRRLSGPMRLWSSIAQDLKEDGVNGTANLLDRGG